MHFSDGSSLALDPGTGARVGDFDAHGGRVLLESGGARVRVTPLPHANWTVDAGPYSVHVIGTEFDIRWSANEEVLDVHLLKGAIVVRGPLARDGLSMEAGAHLFANVRKGEIHLDGQPAARSGGSRRVGGGARGSGCGGGEGDSDSDGYSDHADAGISDGSGGGAADGTRRASSWGVGAKPYDGIRQPAVVFCGAGDRVEPAPGARRLPGHPRRR